MKVGFGLKGRGFRQPTMNPEESNDSRSRGRLNRILLLTDTGSRTSEYDRRRNRMARCANGFPSENQPEMTASRLRAREPTL